MNVTRASKLMRARQVDAIVATTTENFTYLTEYFDVTPRQSRRSRFFALLPRPEIGAVAMICPRINLLYGAQRDVPVLDIRSYGRYNYDVAPDAMLSSEESKLLGIRRLAGEEDDPLTVLVGALEDRGITGGSRVAIDEMGLSHDEWLALRHRMPGVDVVNGYDLLREIRMIKTVDEVTRIRSAIAATSAAMDACIETIHAGAITGDIWHGLRAAMFQYGLMPPWNVGVGIGPASAFAFPEPSPRPVAVGDLVRFDLGGTMDGYVTDFGRTGVIGYPTPKQKQYFEAIRDAQQAGCEAVRPGAVARDIYETVRSVARAAGIPHYDRPGAGHGIGRDIYESPSINAVDATVLEEGMVINIEAPYYELGFGGVQVEDTVLVTSTGCEYVFDRDRSMFRC